MLLPAIGKNWISVPILWIACSSVGCQREFIDTPSAQVLTVAARPVEIRTGYEETTVSTGIVTARETSQLGFEFGGTLKSFSFELGNFVPAGAEIAALDVELLVNQKKICQAEVESAFSLLAELKNGSTAEALARVRADAEALVPQIDELRRRGERYRKLSRSGSVPTQEYEIILAQEQTFRKRYTAAAARYKELLAGTRQEKIDAQNAVVNQLQARCRDIELKIERFKIFAPYPAIISERYIDSGAIVVAGSSVVEVVRADHFEARVGVPVEEVDNFPIQSIHQLMVGEDTVAGEVVNLLPKIDEQTRTATVIFKIETELRPVIGRLVRLTLTRTVPQTGTWLPIESLVTGDGGTWSVYAVRPQVSQSAKTSEELLRTHHIVEKRNVSVLHLDGDRAYIVGDLANQEMVIGKGVNRLVTGQVVKIAVETASK